MISAMLRSPIPVTRYQASGCFLITAQLTHTTRSVHTRNQEQSYAHARTHTSSLNIPPPPLKLTLFNKTFRLLADPPRPSSGDPWLRNPSGFLIRGCFLFGHLWHTAGSWFFQFGYRIGYCHGWHWAHWTGQFPVLGNIFGLVR